MAKFTYIVRDNSGKSVTGVMDATDRNAVISKLRESGYLIQKISEGGSTAASKSSPDLLERLTGKVTVREVAVFSKQFAAMINAGITMMRCLRVLESQTDNKLFKEVIAKIRDGVTGGLPLSQTLAQHPKVFPRLYVAMIKAGEESGSLDKTLKRLAEHMEKDVNLRDEIKSAMTYPAVIAVMMVIIVSILMVFVIPTFERMFEGLGSALPTPTKILMAISRNMKSFWYIYIGVVCFGIPFAYKTFYATPPGRLLIDKLRLKFPVFGLLNRKISVARFTRTLGTLLSSGVPIIGALSIVEEVADNVIIESAISRVRNSIKEGETIAAPLEASNVFPPMVTNMIAVGEESGALDEMLNKVADFYDAEVETMVKSLTSLLEPLLITVMGLMVGGIVIALLLPLFKMIAVLRDMAQK
jgi:type IV pilus assembly protein PilC